MKNSYDSDDFLKDEKLFKRAKNLKNSIADGMSPVDASKIVCWFLFQIDNGISESALKSEFDSKVKAARSAYPIYYF